MALDISELLKVKSDTNIDTSLGTLFLFSISVGNQSSLLKALSSSVAEAEPREYVKNLFKFVCYPENSLKEGIYKPDEPVLTREDIESLTEKELEDIAEAYIQDNEYLFKKREFKKKNNEKGEEVHYSEYSDILHPKNDDEDNIQYLHRLACLEQENQRERMKSIFDSMPKLGSFSKSLTGGIAKNLMLGESLAKSFEAARAIPKIELSPVTSQLKTIDWAAIERKKEKVRREPFEELAKRLDKLINSSSQASEFMVEANKIQTEIAAEIKSGGDVTDRHARKNVKLSIAVILLTISGLVLTGWSSISGVSFSENQQIALDSYSSKITESLEKSRQSVEESSNESKLVLTEILRSLNILNKNIVNSHEKLDDAVRQIDELKISNENYKREIEQLNIELIKLKDEYNKSNKKS
ncbi:hypothetical protein [Pseudoalteromonas phenolica]|uniref:hypothetical protein n=1 Tax=Pseudoalteromonas phenolica TaxID=161398 RepID=UPI00384DAE3C